MKELTETENLELLERYKIQVMFLSQFACSEDLPATEKKADDLIRHIDRVIFHRNRRKQEAPSETPSESLYEPEDMPLVVANEWWKP